MNHNEFRYGSYIFKDGDINDGDIHIENSPIAETLVANRMNVTFLSHAYALTELIDADGENVLDAAGEQILVQEQGDFDFRIMKYGEPITYYHDGKFIGRFYIRNVQSVGKTSEGEILFSVDAISIIGVLTSMYHVGGVYSGETTGEVIASIMGDIPYTIETEVASIPVYGFLPYGTARDNLQMVLFAVGASVITRESGVNIGYNLPTSIKEVPDNRIYAGQGADYLTPATKVNVTEHQYAEDATVEPITLYDNTQTVVADGDFILFDEPCHTLTTTGTLTIGENGVNYAIVSGSGTLTGIPYVHIQRVISKVLSLGAIEENVKVVDKNTLINSLNAENVLERVASYYGGAINDNLDIVVEDERPTELVSYTDLFDESKQGYITSMDMNISAVLKSQTKIATNWRPNHLGNAFTNYRIIKASDLVGGVWTVPEELVGTKAVAVLFGGGQGGQGGYDGEQGGASYWKNAHTLITFPNGNTRWDEGPSYTLGGAGGTAGQGGAAGNILTLNIDSLPATISASMGVGGNGGARNGEEGALGTDTSFFGHSTAEGIPNVGNYVNLVDGTIYAKVGDSQRGINGRQGGAAGWNGRHQVLGNGSWQVFDYDIAYKGEDIGGAQGGNPASYFYDYYESSGGSVSWDAWLYPSGGGGAAVGHSGGNATDGYCDDHAHITAETCSQAGAGANADAPTAETLGSGGKGGNGGGGSGARGLGRNHHINSTKNEYFNYIYPSATVGLGSVGGKGGDGFVLLYTEV